LNSLAHLLNTPLKQSLLSCMMEFLMNSLNMHLWSITDLYN